MIELTAPSGAKIVINPGSWESTSNLINAMRRQLSIVPATTSPLQMEMFLRSAPDVQDALWRCLEKCTYNDQKITKATFEKIEARQDYEVIVEACIAENKSPFPQSPNLVFLGALIPTSVIEEPLK